MLDQGRTIPEDILAILLFVPRTTSTKNTGVGANTLMEGEVQTIVVAQTSLGKVATQDANLVLEQLMCCPDDCIMPFHATVLFKHASDGPLLHANTQHIVCDTMIDHLLTSKQLPEPRTRALIDQLATLVERVQKVLTTADAGVQTGGFPGTGKVVGARSATVKGASPNDLLKVINKIRTSIPVMRAMKLDEDLRKLLLAEMVQTQHSEGLQLVIPKTMIVQHLDQEKWMKYRNLLLGITEANACQVRDNLVKMGIIPSAGTMEHLLVQHPEKRARVDEEGQTGPGQYQPSLATSTLVSKMIGCLSHVVQVVGGVLQPVSGTSPRSRTVASVCKECSTVLGPLRTSPDWAKDAVDACKTLIWDSEQYGATVVVNEKIATLTLVDTSSCMTLIDLEMACNLHLPVKQA